MDKLKHRENILKSIIKEVNERTELEKLRGLIKVTKEALKRANRRLNSPVVKSSTYFRNLSIRDMILKDIQELENKASALEKEEN